MSTPQTRQRPNILVTGTPGTGKSTLAVRLAQELNLRFVDIGREIELGQFYTEYDETYQTYILDEDKLLDFLEEPLGAEEGGVVVDYHSSSLFPKRWFDLIVVLRCENTQILYDRLAARGYARRKLDENMQCEIFGTIAEEAAESYDADRVHQLPNEKLAQLADNVRRIRELLDEQRRAKTKRRSGKS